MLDAILSPVRRRAVVSGFGSICGDTTRGQRSPHDRVLAVFVSDVAAQTQTAAKRFDKLNHPSSPQLRLCLVKCRVTIRHLSNVSSSSLKTTAFSLKTPEEESRHRHYSTWSCCTSCTRTLSICRGRRDPDVSEFPFLTVCSSISDLHLRLNGQTDSSENPDLTELPLETCFKSLLDIMVKQCSHNVVTK